MNRSNFASLGFGVGLRRPHYRRILEQRPPDNVPPENVPPVDWFELFKYAVYGSPDGSEAQTPYW